MPDSRFTYSLDTIRAMVADVLELARERGATEAEADVSEGYGQSVTVRRGEVETIEYNRDKSLGITVFIGRFVGLLRRFSERAQLSSSFATPGRIDK